MKNSMLKSPRIITKGLSNEKVGKDQEIYEIHGNTFKDFIEQEPSYDPKVLLKEILSSEERTEKEIWMLCDAFKEMKFFRQFINHTDDKERVKALLYVFKKIKYESIGAQRCIIRQGEFSDGKVYIVVSGELNVLINKDPKKVRALIERTEVLDEDKEKDENQSPASPSSISSPTLLQSPPLTVSQNNLKYTHRPRSSRRKTQSPELRNQTPVSSHSPTSKVDSPPPQSKLKKNNPTSVSVIRKKASRKEPIFVDQEQLGAYGVVVGQLQKGDHFGERALFDNHQRSASIITNSLVELLVLDRETFKHVLVGFQKAKSHIMDFLSTTLPNLDKVYTKQALESLMYVADVREFAFRANLGVEGEPADQLFLIYEGQCELIKTVIYDNSENVSLATDELRSLYGLKKTKKQDLVILNLERGSFIGEEICFDDKVMLNCTIRVSSERAKIICFPKKLFMFRCPKMIIKGIIKIFAEKKERFTQNLLQKLGKKGVETDYKTLLGIKPVVSMTPKTNLMGLSLNLNSGFPPFNSEVMTENQTSETLEQKISPRSRRILSSAKSKTSTTTEDLAFNIPLTRHSSHKALTTPKSSKVAHFKKLRLDDLGSENEIVAVSPKSRPLLSARLSPKNEKIASPKVFLTSMNEADEKAASRKDEKFMNNVENFKMNFGKPTKEVERRYKALVHKYIGGGTPIKKKRNNSSIFENSSINLADFITRKLRENNFDSIQDEKLVTGGKNGIYESTLESMVELPRSSNNLDLLKSACGSPTNSLHLSKSQSKLRINEELASHRTPPRIQSASSSHGFKRPQTARQEIQPSTYNLTGSFNSEHFNQLLASFSPNANNKFIPRHIRAKTQHSPKAFVNIHVANKNISSLKKPFS